MNKTKSTIDKTMLMQSALCMFISWCAILLCSFILTLAISKEVLDIGTTEYISIALIFLATFLTTIIYQKIGKNKEPLISIMTSALFLISLVIVSVLFFDGLSAKMFGGSIACAAGTLLGILLTRKGNKRAKAKKKHRHSR